MTSEEELWRLWGWGWGVGKRKEKARRWIRGEWGGHGKNRDISSSIIGVRGILFGGTKGRETVGVVR